MSARLQGVYYCELVSFPSRRAPGHRSTRVSKVDAGVGWANPDYFAKVCSPAPVKASVVRGYSRSETLTGTGLWTPLPGVDASMPTVRRGTAISRSFDLAQEDRCTAATAIEAGRKKGDRRVAFVV